MVKKATKAVLKKDSPIKRGAGSKRATKVDYYPNRMTVVISALAGALLMLLALIAVLGEHGW